MFLGGFLLTSNLCWCYNSSTRVLKELYTDCLQVVQGFLKGSKEQKSASIGATSIILGFRTMIIVIL